MLVMYTTSKKFPPMRVTGIAWLFGNWTNTVGAFPVLRYER